MIVVRVIGGIGNQMFQYFFGQYLETKFNEQVFYDVESFTTVNKERSFELQLLFPELNVYKGSKFKFSKEKGIKKRISVFLYRLKKGNHYIYEKDINKIDNIYSEETYFFDGYWQNIDMIQSVVDREKRCFDLSKRLPSILKKTYNNIVNSNSVSVHVRRGDYFTKKNINIYGVCTKDYFNKAIDLLGGYSNEDQRFFIFSDDIDWVKSNINLPRNCEFVHNHEINTYWYIFLMSCCNRNIISNSSFSWWGAFLNRSKNIKVIAPIIWKHSTDKTLVLEDWIKL